MAQFKKLQISKFISYLSSTGPSSSTTSKPTVLLLPWLAAKEKHLSRIYNYYLGRNYDILQVKIKPYMLLRPATITPVSRDMVDYLLEHHPERPLFIHGFSGGLYLYGDIIGTVVEQPKKYGNLNKNLKGYLLDSGANIQGVTKGVAAAITSNSFMKQNIVSIFEGYVNISKEHTLKYYDRVRDIVIYNPAKLPGIWLYSTNDKIMSLKDNIEVIEDIQKNSKNIPFFPHEFDTPHVQHLRYYPKRYFNILDDFLGSVMPGHKIPLEENNLVEPSLIDNRSPDYDKLDLPMESKL